MKMCVRSFFIVAFSAGLLLNVISCKKNNLAADSKPDYDPAKATEALKNAATFKIGAAISNSRYTSDAKYTEIVDRDFNSVTLENEMKNASIVQSNGVHTYTVADAMVSAAMGKGHEIFGHTLAWHSQQNAGYYKSVAGITIPSATELAPNPGFENGGSSSFSNWSVYNSGNPAGTSTISVGSGGNEVRTGTRSMKVFNPVGYPGSQWRVQVASDLIPTVVGKQYIATYWVKAADPGGSIRLSTQPSALYQGDQNIPQVWTQISWTFTANVDMTRILFDMGQAANTYYVDDVSVKEVIAVPSGAQIAVKVDSLLNDFITKTATHFKGKVKAWDVVNEMFTDVGAIRNNSNTDVTPAHVLVWSNYLGRDFGFKAFKYAEAADPAAKLFINDYNLEISPAKLDSLIAYVAEIKARGAKVDGIGTQMHISWNSSYAGIDLMFQKLAATGLLIRVSELDIRVNPANSGSFVLTPAFAGYQADMYKYVVSSYIRNVPAAQRHGITLWGVTDNSSWRYNNGLDFPLLYDINYNKKPAYAGFLQGLKTN